MRRSVAHNVLCGGHLIIGRETGPRGLNPVDRLVPASNFCVEGGVKTHRRGVVVQGECQG